METKQKMFRFTPRTVDLLKIVAGLNQLSETEMLEIALEAVASPEALQLINSIHGERVNRKTLRKPRTTKQKVGQETQEQNDSEDSKVLSIIKSIKERQIVASNTKEIEYIEETNKYIEEEDEKAVVSLDHFDDSLLDMYG